MWHEPTELPTNWKSPQEFASVLMRGGRRRDLVGAQPIIKWPGVLLPGELKKKDVEMMRGFFFGNKNQGVKGISEMAHFEMFCVGHV